MARSRTRGQTKKRRASKQGTVTDKALVRQVERVLATVRRIRQSLADETDLERGRETRRTLRWALRQFTEYRKGLEALRSQPCAGDALEKQIQLFMLVEDECRLDRPEARPA